MLMPLQLGSAVLFSVLILVPEVSDLPFPLILDF